LDTDRFKEGTFEHRGPHHILPTSRGGDDSEDNIYPEEYWPPETEKHVHWHNPLFENMTPQEIIERLEEYTNSDGSLKEEFFEIFFVVKKEKPKGKTKKEWVVKPKRGKSKIRARKRAWAIVFGDMNGCEAIEWIEREFIRKEWLR